MRVERLDGSHDTRPFACGVKELDSWLHNHALENQRRNLSRTFVLLDDANVLVGYYALSMGSVQRRSLPIRYGRGLPLHEIGMVLLARLAISSGRHGEGFGRDLLVEAIGRAADAGAQVAARFIGVDPIDEDARHFYRKFGFKQIEGDSEARMFLRIDHAIEALNGAD